MSEHQELFPYADSSAIVRAHQKDSYFENYLNNLIQDAVKPFFGQGFVMSHRDKFLTIAKFLYLSLTTLRNSRTLGEEYVDLIYLNRSGKSLPKTWRKLGFIMSYTLLPYLVSRLVSKLKKQDLEDEAKEKGFLVRFLPIIGRLNSVMEINLAVFYLFGAYYQVSKRVFGLRYGLGHSVKPQQDKAKNQLVGYEILGTLISLKVGSSILGAVSGYINDKLVAYGQQQLDQPLDTQTGVIYNLHSAVQQKTEAIDLSDPSKLPYLVGQARICMLCLTDLTNPASLPCGHFSCWSCIIDWCKENNACPLCRKDINNKFVLMK